MKPLPPVTRMTGSDRMNPRHSLEPRHGQSRRARVALLQQTDGGEHRTRWNQGGRPSADRVQKVVDDEIAEFLIISTRADFELPGTPAIHGDLQVPPIPELPLDETATASDSIGIRQP